MATASEEHTRAAADGDDIASTDLVSAGDPERAGHMLQDSAVSTAAGVAEGGDDDAPKKKARKKKKKKVAVEIPQNEQWDAVVGRNPSSSSSSAPGWLPAAQITVAVAACIGLFAIIRKVLPAGKTKKVKSSSSTAGKTKTTVVKVPRVQAKDVFLPVHCVLEPSTPSASGTSKVTLQGLTFTIAECVDAVGTPSTWGYDAAPANTLDNIPIPEPCSTSAAAVTKLLSAGARCIAKSRVAFLGHELEPHPRVSLGNKQLLGGGPVGAAAAVAGGLVDCGVANDHIGGGRIVAGCCGVAAYRCSPGVGGSLGWKMSPTDCVCLMAKDIHTIRRLSQCLEVPGNANLKGEIQRIYVAEDMFKLCDIELKPALQATKLAIQKWAGEEEVGQFHFTGYLDVHLRPTWRKLVPDLLEPSGPQPTPPPLPPVLEGLRRAAQLLYAHDLHKRFGHLLGSTEESDNAAVQYLEAAAAIKEERIALATQVMTDLRDMLRESLRPDVVLVLPILAAPPPVDASPELAQAYFNRAHLFSSIATMAGAPTACLVPGYTKDGRPLAIGLLSVHRTDARLLAVAEKLEPIIKEQLLLVQDGLLERMAKEAADKKAAEEKKRLEDEKKHEKAEALKEKGNQLLSAGQYDKAIAQYTQAIKLNPKNPVYYSNRALVHLKQFSWLEAEQDSTSALENASNDKVKVKALLRRAMARRALSKFRPALADLEQVIALEPKNKDALMEREDLLHEAQAYQEQLLQQQQQMRGGLMGNGNGHPDMGAEELGYDEMGLDEQEVDLNNLDPVMAEQYKQYLMQQQLAEGAR